MTRVWVIFHEWEDYEHHQDVVAICSSSAMAQQIMIKLEKTEMTGSWLAEDRGYNIQEVPLNRVWENLI